MKKTFIFILLLMFCLVLTSCDMGLSNNTNDFSFEYQYDELNHFKINSQTLSIDVEPHNFSDWKVLDSNTKERGCSICGYKETKVDEEIISNEYYYDENYHFHLNEETHEVCDIFPHFFLSEVLQPELSTAHFNVYAQTCSICGYKHLVYHEKVTTDIPEYTLEELKNLNTTITFWHAMGQAKSAIIQEMVNSFNKIYPNITVNIASQGGYDDLRDKIARSIRTGNTPTLAQVTTNHVPLYLKSNAISELNTYVNHQTYGLTQAQYADYIDAYLEEGMIYDSAKTLYSLPFNKSTEVLYFNATWFQENGLLERYNLGTISDGVFQRNPGARLSWEDIEEIGQYFISTDEYQAMSTWEQLDNYAFSYDSDDNLFITLTLQFGGEYTKLTSEGKGEYLFNNAKSREAVQWYYDSFKAGYFVTASAWNADYTSDKFTSGNVKINVGSSAGCSYNDPGDKFVLGVLPYPQWEDAAKEKKVIQQGTNVALFKCDDPDEELAGWLFLKFITTWTQGLSYDQQPTYIWATQSGYFPILKSLMNSPEYQEFLNGNNGQKSLTAIVTNIALEQENYNYITPAFPDSDKCRQEVGYLLERVLYAGISIEQAYNDAINNLRY